MIWCIGVLAILFLFLYLFVLFVVEFYCYSVIFYFVLVLVFPIYVSFYFFFSGCFGGARLLHWPSPPFLFSSLLSSPEICCVTRHSLATSTSTLHHFITSSLYRFLFCCFLVVSPPLRVTPGGASPHITIWYILIYTNISISQHLIVN